MPERTRVLAIVYESEHDALMPGTISLAKELGELGYSVEIVDLRAVDNFQYLHKALATGEIAFVYGIQGVGSQLHINQQSLWTLAQTPFISLHYDHPSHAIPNHVAKSPYIVNLYHYAAFFDDFCKYVAPICGERRLAGRLPVRAKKVPESPLPFEKRPIKFLYLKSYVKLEPYIEHFNGLPQPLRDGVWDRINQAMKNPNLSLCDLACGLFETETFAAPGNQVEFWAIVKAMDLYIRHKRAIDFVDWLKMQEGAVIYGTGWEKIDRDGARAEFRPSIGLEHVVGLYQNTQFTCNTNPYGRDMIHERLINGLIYGGAVVTDTNAWTDATLGDVNSLIRFNWNASLDEQIKPYLERAAENQDGRQRVFDLLTGETNAAKIASYAKQTRTFVDSLK